MPSSFSLKAYIDIFCTVSINLISINIYIYIVFIVVFTCAFNWFILRYDELIGEGNSYAYAPHVIVPYFCFCDN